MSEDDDFESPSTPPISGKQLGGRENELPRYKTRERSAPSGITVERSAELYLLERTTQVSASTVRLERDALKPVIQHIGTVFIGRITPQVVNYYVLLRI